MKNTITKRSILARAKRDPKYAKELNTTAEVMTGTAVKTPELDKMLGVKPRADIIAGFLNWLDENKRVICGHDGDEYWPIATNKEKLLAEFLDIDLDKCERERMAILESLRRKS